MSMFNMAREIVKRNSFNVESEGVREQDGSDGNEYHVDDSNAGHIEQAVYIDDGRPVADMNIEGFSWYYKHKFNNDRKELLDLNITHKERLAMLLGALSAMLPIVIFMGLVYGGAFLVLYFWMK